MALLDHFAVISCPSTMPAGAVVRPRTMSGRSADIRRYDLEKDGMIDRLSLWIAEGRKVDVLHLDAPV